MGSSTYIGGSHLEFSKMPLLKGRKMHIYKIYNKKLDQVIGEIHWRGGWRQYVSQTFSRVDMSVSCHDEISKFIRKIMKEWRKNLKKQNETNN